MQNNDSIVFNNWQPSAESWWPFEVNYNLSRNALVTPKDGTHIPISFPYASQTISSSSILRIRDVHWDWGFRFPRHHSFSLSSLPAKKCSCLPGASTVSDNAGKSDMASKWWSYGQAGPLFTGVNGLKSWDKLHVKNIYTSSSYPSMVSKPSPKQRLFADRGVVSSLTEISTQDAALILSHQRWPASFSLELDNERWKFILCNLLINMVEKKPQCVSRSLSRPKAVSQVQWTVGRFEHVLVCMGTSTSLLFWQDEHKPEFKDLTKLEDQPLNVEVSSVDSWYIEKNVRRISRL